LLVDVRALPRDTRLAAAERIRTASDFTLPELEWFNTQPCQRHTSLEEGIAQVPPCRRCGIRFRKHQRVGIAWLFMRGRGLIADQVGPQPLHAQVLTPTGYRRMGDLSVGDAVIDPDGQTSAITGVYPQGEQSVYRITFSDGTWAESTLNHLWKIRGPIEPYRTRVGREYRDGEVWHVRTLDEISRRAKSSAVPLIAQPPDFAEADLPLDPYLLGLLLGDGCLSRNTPQFLSADLELLNAAQHLRPTGWGWSYAGHRTGCEIYSFPGGASILRDLGLYRHRAWNKFVPQQYKWASAKTRLAVLQGLMDTDGNWASGSVEFASTSPQLAQDVADLARSLGLRTSGPHPRETFYTYQGERKAGRTAYRVCIAETDEIRVFRLDRKLRPQPRRRLRGDLTNAGARQGWRRDQRVKWIRKIEHIGQMPVQCISVSAPSQLYVTDNWTVTHNTGKTGQAAGLLACCKQVGELDEHRAVVIVRPSALPQWYTELQRFLPKLAIGTATGTRQQRIERYLSPWDILLTGYQMFVRDRELIENFPVGTLIVDDVDALRNPTNQTAYAIKRLARSCSRVVLLTGTPLQKRLHELHSVLEPVGGNEVFGTATAFRLRYVREELVSVYNPHAGRLVKTRKCIGYKNLDEFKTLIAPFALRRTPEDIDDVDLPVISPPNNIYLDLYPVQAQRYAELRKGVLKIIRSEGATVKRAKAAAQFLYGAKICAGLATLGEPDGPATSVKLDWIENILVDGDLSDEKVVVFCHFTDAVAALAKRLAGNGIGHEVIWGRDNNKTNRARAQARFWDDPTCRVLVGTEAIEQSLNLQVSRHLINMDQLMNPARMTQLAGRIRRDGSSYKTVYIHNLLARGTQEEGYLDVLGREQALADHVWGESNQLYEALNPLAMLQLIGRSAGSR
jgi:hypothetical protein